MINFFRPIRPLLRGWVVALVVFGLVAVAISTQFISLTQAPLAVAVRSSVRDWVPWIVLAPLLFRLTDRFPLALRPDARRWLLHLSVGGMVILLTLLWKEALHPGFRPGPGGPMRRGAMGRPPPPPPGARQPHGPRRPGHFFDLLYIGTFQLPVYLMILSAAHAVLFYRRDQERAESLARARLDVLTAQLQPHFLFNTLNTIAELVHEDPNRADTMITALSEMLRLTLDAKAEALVPLQHEKEFIERYLAIMQMRFGERVRYQCEIAEAAGSVLVPRFLLQPLVENAIKHGLDPKPEGGTITIRAERAEGFLRITVHDDGVGYAPKENGREGMGLANTRARLHALYGEAASVAVKGENGTAVEIVLPERSA